MIFSILGVRLRNSKDEQLLTSDNIATSLCDILSNNKETNIVNETEKEMSITSNSDDGEYELYSRVETHMSISSSLYILNCQGISIIKNIYNKKLLTNKDQDVQRVYNEMEYIINENRVSHDLYTKLLNILDSIMFEECGELDSFYVKEEEYTLESLYYKQGSWVCELEWDEQQVFVFSIQKGFDEGECMYLLMYIMKYMNLLTYIENQYTNIKLRACTDKIKDKLRNIHYIIQNNLEEHVEQDDIVVRTRNHMA
jgi:hypothetical protein